MVSLKKQQTHINIFLYETEAFLEKASLKVLEKIKELNKIQGQDVNLKMINVNVTKELTLEDLNKVLSKIPNSFNDVIFNFIGYTWEEKQTFGLFAYMLYNGINHKVVKLNLFKETSLEELDFEQSSLGFKKITTTVSKETDYVVPENALPHFNFKVVEAGQIFETVTATNVVYCKETKTFNVEGNYNILDNGLDPDFTMDMSTLVAEYGNVKILTQSKPGIIQSALLEQNEDIVLRNYATVKIIRSYSRQLPSLVKKGYLELSHVDEEGEVYKFTSKGLEYIENSMVRKSVREGLAIDDIIVNLKSNKYFKVMNFNSITGKYLLMDSEYKASNLDIIFDTEHFHALSQEKIKFEELINS